MRLREHPLMTYRGLRSWPPTWTWVGGSDNRYPTGEVGILKEVKPSRIEPADRIFLHIEYEGASYIGCLLIDDRPFCLQIAALLQRSCGRALNEVGEIDLSHTF